MNMRLVVCTKENKRKYSFRKQADDPKCKEHDVFVRIDSCALSNTDYKLLEKFCEPDDEKCFPVGREISGKVVSVGDEVTRFKEHDEVAGIIPFDSPSSGCASTCIISEYDLVLKPNSVSFVDGAAVIGDGLRAYTCLYYQARLCSAETVVVSGATNGFGIIAIQLAQYIGAKVIAVGCTDQEIVFLKSMNPPPDQVVDLRNTRRDIVSVCMEETGGLGVDCFIDDGVQMYQEEFQEAVGFEKRRQPSKHQVISSLAVGGRWITSQKDLQIDPPDSEMLTLKCSSIHYLFEQSWSLSRGAVGRYLHILEDVMAKIEQRALRPMVHHTVMLEDCTESVENIEKSTVGKVVVKIK